jgi:hypothetical protein
MSKKPPVKDPHVVFTVRVFARPAMSRSIEAHQIRETLELAAHCVGGSNGAKLHDQLFGPHDLQLEDRPLWGDFLWDPIAPK